MDPLHLERAALIEQLDLQEALDAVENLYSGPELPLLTTRSSQPVEINDKNNENNVSDTLTLIPMTVLKRVNKGEISYDAVNELCTEAMGYLKTSLQESSTVEFQSITERYADVWDAIAADQSYKVRQKMKDFLEIWKSNVWFSNELQRQVNRARKERVQRVLQAWQKRTHQMRQVHQLSQKAHKHRQRLCLKHLKMYAHRSMAIQAQRHRAQRHILQSIFQQWRQNSKKLKQFGLLLVAANSRQELLKMRSAWDQWNCQDDSQENSLQHSSRRTSLRSSSTPRNNRIVKDVFRRWKRGSWTTPRLKELNNRCIRRSLESVWQRWMNARPAPVQPLPPGEMENNQILSKKDSWSPMESQVPETKSISTSYQRRKSSETEVEPEEIRVVDVVTNRSATPRKSSNPSTTVETDYDVQQWTASQVGSWLVDIFALPKHFAQECTLTGSQLISNVTSSSLSSQHGQNLLPSLPLFFLSRRNRTHLLTSRKILLSNSENTNTPRVQDVVQWSCSDVMEWLQQHPILHRYTSSFRQVDGITLLHMTPGLLYSDFQFQTRQHVRLFMALKQELVAKHTNGTYTLLNPKEIITSSISTITSWLTHALKLPQYARVFEQRGINGASLLQLTDISLKKMGIVSKMHRERILHFKMEIQVVHERQQRLANSSGQKEQWKVKTANKVLPSPRKQQLFRKKQPSSPKKEIRSKWQTKFPNTITTRYHRLLGNTGLRTLLFDCCSLLERRELSLPDFVTAIDDTSTGWIHARHFEKVMNSMHLGYTAAHMYVFEMIF